MKQNVFFYIKRIDNLYIYGSILNKVYRNYLSTSNSLRTTVKQKSVTATGRYSFNPLSGGQGERYTSTT